MARMVRKAKAYICVPSSEYRPTGARPVLSPTRPRRGIAVYRINCPNCREPYNVRQESFGVLRTCTVCGTKWRPTNPKRKLWAGIFLGIGALALFGMMLPKGQKPPQEALQQAPEPKAERKAKEPREKAPKPEKPPKEDEYEAETRLPVPEQTVTAQALADAFQQRRTADYLGKRFRVRGIVHQIVLKPVKLPLGKRPNPFIRLGWTPFAEDPARNARQAAQDERTRLEGVEVFFPLSLVPQLEALKEGERVTVDCTVVKTTSHGFTCRAGALEKGTHQEGP